MRQQHHPGRVHPISCEPLTDPVDHSLGNVPRRGRDLGDTDPTGLLVDQHDVGKRPADIDPDPPRHREPLTSRHEIMLALAAEIDQQRSERMDVKLVREEAIEATNRAFWDRSGFVPDEDSDEWEDEYRRQFDLAKKRHATERPADTPPIVPIAPPDEEPGWAALTGPPTQIRWAAALRADRLKEIRDSGIREWLATTWTRSKSWIDTNSLPTATFLKRIEPHYVQYRRQADERARLLAAEQQAKAAAAEEIRRQVEEAAITVEGLIELIDIADRFPVLPIKAKLAELATAERNLRVFETEDPAVLMVLEKAGTSRSEYGIERDEGLVADLRLYARVLELS